MSVEEVDISSLDVNPSTPFEIDDAKLAEQIKTFRTMVQDTIAKVPEGDKPYWESDHLFKRVIRARKGDLNAAKKMYAEIIKFRVEKAVHTMLEKYREPEVLRRYFPWGFSGLDKEGYPVLVERIGTIDLVGIGGALGTEKYLEWVTWYHELQEQVLREICQILGKDRHMMTCIIDMNGISLRHLSATTLNLVKARVRLEEDNYPEVAHKVLLINTPSIFSTVWSGIRAFLDEGTASKFEIKGSDYLPTLRKYIPDSSIPAYLGGTLVDKYNDPYCASIISLGGIVPGDFVTNVATDGKGPGAEAQVPSGRRSDVLLQVPAGSKVSWRWAAQEDEISFGVYAAPLAKEEEDKHPNPDGLTLNVVTGSAYALHKAPCKKAVPENGAFSVAFKPSKTVNENIPFARKSTAATEVVAPKAMNKHFGEWIAPTDGDATHYVVRLFWDNSSSWIKNKTLFRRIDTILADDLPIEKALDEYNEHVNATLFKEEGATMPVPEGADRIWKAEDEDHIKAIERKRRMATVKSWAKIDTST